MVVRRHARRRIGDFGELTFNQRWELLFGSPMLIPGDFGGEDEMRMAWDGHRDEIVAEFIERRGSGKRPFAQWMFEIVPAHGERPVTGTFPDGCDGNWRLHGILHTHLQPPAQEAEHRFLYRIGIIDRDEYEEAEAAYQDECDFYTRLFASIPKQQRLSTPACAGGNE
ncbi:MAG: hypothetical protein LLG00_05000 [Planctomycetaceae bacterium]|nr:hypothetical protein [Planctomycetaceae bacterium]